MGQTPTLHWPCGQSRCGLARVTEHGADADTALAMQSCSHSVAQRGSAWGPAGSVSIAWPRGCQHGADHGRHCTAMQSVTVWPRGCQHGVDHGRHCTAMQSVTVWPRVGQHGRADADTALPYSQSRCGPAWSLSIIIIIIYIYHCAHQRPERPHDTY